MTWLANILPLLPNVLSVFRGLVGLILPLLMLNPAPAAHGAALLLFTLAALTDQWDGALARRLQVESWSGKILDPTMDKVLILAVLAAFARCAFYSIWWVIPIAAREIVITFCRIGWLYAGQSIGAEKAGKVKFCLQVATVGFAFLYLLSRDFAPSGTLGRVFHTLTLVFLAASLFLTIYSGITFFLHHQSLCQSRAFKKFSAALGVGLFPWAPGTWGSLVGLLLASMVSFNLFLHTAVLVLLIALGHWATRDADLEREKDPPYVVVDEACGILLAFMGVPLHGASVLTGFFLFRFFDILKPYPLKRLEQFPGYGGILYDDLGAGLYTWLLLQLLF